MKIRCINNTGEALRPYEYQAIEKNVMGRFGATAYSEYGDLEIGKEYFVMGIITFQTYQAYLIDDNSSIAACPCQLFEIIDDKLSSNWHFRLIQKEENIYPFIQAICGYPELCSDLKSYEDLIVEKEDAAYKAYFRRKQELES